MSETINSRPSTHGMVRSNSYSSCFPCDRSTASLTTSSAMQLDNVPRGQECGDVAAISDGPSTRQSASVQPRPPQLQQRNQQTGPTTNNNVDELVAKAKKAAVSLWMILHAQNCRQTEDNCPHRGCFETKRLLAHVKTCPAGPGFPCPTRCKGCNETRKLLAHYRRCKDMRTRRVGTGRRSGLQSDKSCLVCSLVARYAKIAMDRTTKSGTSQGKNDRAVTSLLSSPMDGKFNVERGLAGFSEKRANVSPTKNPKRTPSMTLMPPPPPRPLSVSAPSTVRINLAKESFQGTPSPQFDSVSGITDPWSAPTSSRTSDLDSKVRIPFPILRNASRKVEAADDEMAFPAGPATIAANCVRRQRAESYDERQTRVVKFAPTVITGKQYDSDEHEEQRSVSSMTFQSNHNSPTRPRSASLGCNDISATSMSAHGCGAIAEGGVEEESIFPMD